MGKPKKRTTSRRTGSRRSHLVLKLARKVNAKSPVKAFTTTKEFGSSKPKPSKPSTSQAKASAKSKSTAKSSRKTTK